MSGKALRRSRNNRVLAGVCGGLANYFNVDASLIRLLFIVFTILGGEGILVYIVLWIAMPNEEKHQRDSKRKNDETIIVYE